MSLAFLPEAYNFINLNGLFSKGTYESPAIYTETTV